MAEEDTITAGAKERGGGGGVEECLLREGTKGVKKGWNMTRKRKLFPGPGEILLTQTQSVSTFAEHNQDPVKQHQGSSLIVSSFPVNKANTQCVCVRCLTSSGLQV